MSNLQPTNELKLSDIIKDIELVKYNPSSIINIILNRLKDAYDGKINIVDASNPFIYLLETSCLNGVNAINEYTALTRKLYPRLANNDEDLYRHMSDYDYLGLFSEPSVATVKVYILYSDFYNYGVFDSNTNSYVFKIPRNYTINIDNYNYTFLYPIIIRRYANDTISVRYDATISNDLEILKTDYINFDIIRTNNNEKWIVFDIELKELKIDSVQFPVEKSRLFREKIDLSNNRKYYYAHCYYYKNNQWVKMLTTHSDYVFDINKPTACIKVLPQSNEVEIFIPSMYIYNGVIDSKVRIDIYTTNGYCDVDFTNRVLSDFSSEYNAIDPDNDLDDYTSSLNSITKLIYIPSKVRGGKDALDFNQIKENVINNSIGDRLLPITNKQLEFYTDQNNFKLIKDVDIITNRLFLLQVNIPNARTRYPVSRLDLDSIDVSFTLNDLLQTNLVKAYKNNLYIIKENTVFKLDNGIASILTQSEVNNISNLSAEELLIYLNTNKLIFTLYQYVIDTSNNTPTVRPYSVSDVRVEHFSFENYNPTCSVGLNTKSAKLYKTDNGYYLDVVTIIKKYGTPLNIVDIAPILIYTIGNSHYYINGFLHSEINSDTAIYRFYINSNYVIDANNKITIEDVYDVNGNTTDIDVDLTDNFTMLYTLNNKPVNYAPSSSDDYIYLSYLSFNRGVVTQEKIRLTLATDLQRLYSRLRVSTNIDVYKRYDTNIPLTYEENVYQYNNILSNIPYYDTNGNLLSTIVHHRGDTVLDNNNNIIYKHKIGDIMLDENNNPIVIDTNDLLYTVLMLFRDYRLNFVTSTDTINYYDYVKSTVTKLVTDNASKVNDILLENTKSYVTIPKSINYIKANVDNLDVYIDPSCSLNVEIYVSNEVYNDIDLKESIDYTVIKVIDDYLVSNTFSKSELVSLLHSALKSHIKTIDIKNFTQYNASYIKILDEQSKLTVKKKLVRYSSGVYDLKEDVNITYINVDNI